MSLAHPFQRATRRPFPRRPATAVTARPTRTSPPTGDAAVREPVVPSTRTPAGLPRDLVVDESGKPRRSVLLAAIMIRRGRSVEEISAATGLSAEVVTCLSRSV